MGAFPHEGGGYSEGRHHQGRRGRQRGSGQARHARSQNAQGPTAPRKGSGPAGRPRGRPASYDAERHGSRARQGPSEEKGREAVPRRGPEEVPRTQNWASWSA
eukprot:8146845-Heterocapsa_arctica.AAC.1